MAYSADEAEELLKSPEGRRKVLAVALSRVSYEGATRNEVDAAKEMRQCALAAHELVEREELEALAARMEVAAARMDGDAPLADDGEDEAAPSDGAGG